MEDSPRLFPVLWGLWVFYFARGELRTGRELGEQLLALAHRLQDPALLLEAHPALGATWQHLSQVVTARAHLEQALALFDPQQHRAHAVLYEQDPQVTGCADLACVLWMLGYPDQAWQRSHETLTVAQGHKILRGIVCMAVPGSSQVEFLRSLRHTPCHGYESNVDAHCSRLRRFAACHGGWPGICRCG